MIQKKLHNKRIIISASAEGIGKSITQACLLNGANIVRVHDIKETLRTVSIAERIKGVL